MVQILFEFAFRFDPVPVNFVLSILFVSGVNEFLLYKVGRICCGKCYIILYLNYIIHTFRPFDVLENQIPVIPNLFSNLIFCVDILIQVQDDGNRLLINHLIKFKPLGLSRSNDALNLQG